MKYNKSQTAADATFASWTTTSFGNGQLRIFASGDFKKSERKEIRSFL